WPWRVSWARRRGWPPSSPARCWVRRWRAPGRPHPPRQLRESLRGPWRGGGHVGRAAGAEQLEAIAPRAHPRLAEAEVEPRLEGDGLDAAREGRGAAQEIEVGAPDLAAGDRRVAGRFDQISNERNS